jgi:hypothetical protein
VLPRVNLHNSVNRSIRRLSLFFFSYPGFFLLGTVIDRNVMTLKAFFV